MFIECFQREMAVCHHGEIEGFLARDPGRWQVISIREPDHPEAVLKDALKAHDVVFEDVLTSAGNQGHGPKAAHLEGILRFVERSAGAPLLIQCWAGRSRSTAVALVVIVQTLWDKGMDGAGLVRMAADLLLQIRPVAIPNRLVLRLGLELFLPG
ncbi:MAG: hypothetical protein Q8M07_12440, partial [Prosthecobacter sp.]|nr:hypothetical protein [Prosthecobacter sp.]